MSVVRIPLSGGRFAQVDAAEAERVLEAGNWIAAVHGPIIYAQRSLYRADGRRTTQTMHRFLMDGCSRVDHRDGDGLNNTRANLRETTVGQNAHNSRRHRDSTSSFKGVNLAPSNRWRARISVEGVRKHLGLYATAELAALAFDDAARELHGEFACLNFPNPEERAA